MGSWWFRSISSARLWPIRARRKSGRDRPRCWAIVVLPVPASPVRTRTGRSPSMQAVMDSSTCRCAADRYNWPGAGADRKLGQKDAKGDRSMILSLGRQGSGQGSWPEWKA